MADVFTKAKRSEVMARIRGRGNKDTELALAKVFRLNRITGWRRQVEIQVVAAVFGRRSLRAATAGAHRAPLQKPLRVRPDFIFPKLKLAVFVDGCFWHGCPKHGTKPKNNAVFWRKKLATNKRRDALVTQTLRKAGWRVVRLWEHALRRANQKQLLARLVRVLNAAGCD